MSFGHTAVGALVTGIVLMAASAVPATAAPAAILPPGCTSSALSGGGAHIVCTQGLRPSDGPLNGTGRADVIEVRGGDAHLNGAVNGLGGDDVIIVDRVSASGDSSEIRGSVDGGDGDDRITVTDTDRFSAEGPLRGGAGDDTITTGDISFRGLVDGGPGNDTITTGRVHGTDVDGGPGDDVLRLTAYIVPEYDTTSRLHGGPGDDTLTVGTLGGPLRGGPGHDVITVDGINRPTSRLPRPVVIDGEEGDDVLRLGPLGANQPEEERAASVRGSAGADLIEVPSLGQARGADVSGGDGDDVIQGPGGTPTLVGPQGTVDGGGGDNLCRTERPAAGTVVNCRA